MNQLLPELNWEVHATFSFVVSFSGLQSVGRDLSGGLRDVLLLFQIPLKNNVEI